MPEIMRQYGQTMLVIITVTLISTLLFTTWPSNGGNVLSAVGAAATSQMASQDRGGERAGSQRFDEHAARQAPQARAKGPIKEGIPTLLTDQFAITDSDGATWHRTAGPHGEFVTPDGAGNGGAVQVESLTAPDGTELVNNTSLYIPTTDQATFPSSGIYRVRMRILDHDNVEAIYTIALTVDLTTED